MTGVIGRLIMTFSQFFTLKLNARNIIAGTYIGCALLYLYISDFTQLSTLEKIRGESSLIVFFLGMLCFPSHLVSVTLLLVVSQLFDMSPLFGHLAYSSLFIFFQILIAVSIYQYMTGKSEDRKNRISARGTEQNLEKGSK